MIYLKYLLEAGRAAKEAQRKGLTYAGWGRWSDRRGNVVAKTVDDKLVFEPEQQAARHILHNTPKSYNDNSTRWNDKFTQVMLQKHGWSDEDINMIRTTFIRAGEKAYANIKRKNPQFNMRSDDNNFGKFIVPVESIGIEFNNLRAEYFISMMRRELTKRLLGNRSEIKPGSMIRNKQDGLWYTAEFIDKPRGTVYAISDDGKTVELPMKNITAVDV